MISRFFKQLFCRHRFGLAHSYKMDGGMTKVVVSQCSECGKLVTKKI